jgi:integrase
MFEIDQQSLKVKAHGNRITKEFVPKWQLVSSHTARRTFITQSLAKGMKPYNTMKMTGHSSMRSFEKYIRLTEQEAYDETI